MTPGARLSAAIELLDAILAGAPAERELTRWARASRFAGSKDRAAVRDLVYDGLRRRRSLGWVGGGDTGRAIVLAHAAAAGDARRALHRRGLRSGAGVRGRARRPRLRSRRRPGGRAPRLSRLPPRRPRRLARARLRAGAGGDARARARRPPRQHPQDHGRRRHRRPRPRRGAGRPPPARPQRAARPRQSPPRRREPRLYPGHGRAPGRLVARSSPRPRAPAPA